MVALIGFEVRIKSQPKKLYLLAEFFKKISVYVKRGAQLIQKLIVALQLSEK